MPADAVRWVRRMRGGAQAHLVGASDGHYYVVKCRNNPQHRRILANEWIASCLLRHLSIAAAEPSLIRIPAAFLDENPDCCFQLGSQRRPVEPGWHFGSRYPGDPAAVMVFDFLPDALLVQVANVGDFVGMLAFDKWVSNADSRQAVYYRARLTDPATGSSHVGFAGLMIDHGFSFQGPEWSFGETARAGLYHRRTVYEGVRGWSDFDPWITRMEHFPEAVVDQTCKQIPEEWIEGDRPGLERLLEGLFQRRRRIRGMIDQIRADAGLGLFPNWR